MANLMAEVERFRTWAGSNPPSTRSRDQPLHFADGEWEGDYPGWPELYAAVLEHVAAGPPDSWSGGQMQAVLYALARDNEGEYLAEEIRLHHPETFIALARAALSGGEPDAKWQVAEQLAHVDLGDVEGLLLILVADEHEYVRRMALRALAQVGSSATERLALDAWHRPDERQEYARMMALDCLHRIGSPLLEHLLAEAERDERQHLRDFARKFRQGQTD